MRVVFVGRDRRVWPRLLAYVFTLGISRRVWLHRINKELDGHEALGLDHRINAALLSFPVVTPSIVTAQTAARTARMLTGSGIPYGPAPLVYLATWVPILGNLFFISWQQSRLNRFWKHEREHPEHGFEVELDLSNDPAFVAELQRALKESYHAGSRFDRAKERKDEKKAERREAWQAIQAERARVRAAGGSTPVLPWRRPQCPAPRRLDITCGRCEHRFHVERDPFAETVLHCPNCGLHEVLPSLRGDDLAPKEPAVYPVVRVTCPDCGTVSSHQRDPRSETPVACPRCGHAETLGPRTA